MEGEPDGRAAHSASTLGARGSGHPWTQGGQLDLQVATAAKLLDLTDALIHYLRVKKLPPGCEGPWWKQALGTLRAFLLGSLRLFPWGSQAVPGSRSVHRSFSSTVRSG